MELNSLKCCIWSRGL